MPNIGGSITAVGDTSEEIYVDTAAGRGYWRKGAFGFADSKVPGYSLHEVWAHRFEDCHAAERSFHRQFSHRHINGEWFDLGEDDLSSMRRGVRAIT